jgi:Tfp pilus assembly protein FimT
MTLVVILLGILAALAAPNLASYIGRTRIDGALNELTGNIAYTRMLAVESGRSATLTIQPGGSAYTITTTRVVGSNEVKRIGKQVNLAPDTRGYFDNIPGTHLQLARFACTCG